MSTRREANRALFSVIVAGAIPRIGTAAELQAIALPPPKQDYVKTAPLNLIYVSDAARMKDPHAGTMV
jgi:hypothetical protein